MLELHLLPARQGDAIWVRWGQKQLTHQLIVDMGTLGVGKRLRERLEELPEKARRFELLVVTHIDADHIGGVLTCLMDAAPLKGLEFGDIWFNGLDHLPITKKTDIEEQGGAQGSRFAIWLAGRTWNEYFEGEAVYRNKKPKTVRLPGGLSITILGPTSKRLAALAPVWSKELEVALKKKRAKEGGGAVESLGRRQVEPRLASTDDLRRLAAMSTGADDSEPNGSSIFLLLEHGRRKVLLTGDAYAQDIIAGIDSLGVKRPFKIDALKVPHHGSSQNVTKELIRAVECPLFLFSTDGTQFEHPDAAAVACVIANARSRPVKLAFNARSAFSGWWAKKAWTSKFGYSAEYGSKADGLRIPF